MTSTNPSTQKQRFKIAVIGTGDEGSALIKKLTKLGHTVCMANAADSQTLQALAKETGAEPKQIPEVVRHAEITFLSIPMKDVQNLPKDLASVCSENCIFVDTCNYYPSRDGKIQAIEEGMPESMWVTQQIGKPVIKALNTVLAPALMEAGCPKGTAGRVAVPVSGDDSNAKNIICNLVDEMGFDAYDAGDLSSSWRQQPGSPAYCTNLDLQHLVPALNAANKQAMPQLRDDAYRKMTASDKQMSWKEIVDMLRSTYGDETKQISSSELKGQPTSASGSAQEQPRAVET
jgi:predicted dinucleotide-binding enzyme